MSGAGRRPAVHRRAEAGPCRSPGRQSASTLSKTSGADLADRAHLPDDGRRYEVVDGTLMMGPPPTVVHETVAQRCSHRFLKPVENADAGLPAHGRVELDPERLVVVLRLLGDRFEVVQELNGRGVVEVSFRVELDLPALPPRLTDWAPTRRSGPAVYDPYLAAVDGEAGDQPP